MKPHTYKEELLQKHISWIIIENQWRDTHQRFKTVWTSQKCKQCPEVGKANMPLAMLCCSQHGIQFKIACLPLRGSPISKLSLPVSIWQQNRILRCNHDWIDWFGPDISLSNRFISSSCLHLYIKWYYSFVCNLVYCLHPIEKLSRDTAFSTYCMCA